MTKDETATLLAFVSSLDRQPVDDGVIEMWWRMLGDFTFEECNDAIVPAYREMTGHYLSSKDVWSIVKRVRSQPVAGGWIRDQHHRGEHWACKPGQFDCKPPEVTA
jgi:hypothetical protein